MLASLFAAAPAAADHPDLVADPPARPVLQVQADENGVERLLLRFDGFVHNAGPGPLEITGSVPVGGVMTSVVQILQGAPPLLDIAAEMKFENTDGHNHWHLQRAARYSLWNASGTALMAPVMKVGFCLMDSEPTGGGARAYTGSCGAWRPNAPSVTMGVSPGWRDVYFRDLPFQWVDVSETQPGAYRLRAEVDPDGLIAELDEDNIPSDTDVEVPGHLAQPATVLADGPVAIPLRADTFGLAGPRAFSVADPPEHGAVSLTGDTATYTPDGPVQPDRFAVVARDTASDYPRHPARATIAVVPAGGTAVAMAGVPERMPTGTAVELRAVGAGPVEWAVDGVPGGNDTVGTISADGHYVAPATPPPRGAVTISARAGVAHDAMTVAIVTPPPPEPAPAPGPDTGGIPATPPPSRTVVPALPPAPPAGAVTPSSAAEQPRDDARPRRSRRRRTPVGSVRYRLVGPNLAVAVRPRRSGRLRVSLMRARRRLASCVVRRARARRSHLCRIRARRGATVLAVTLRPRHGRVERRRIGLRRHAAHRRR